AVKRREPRPRPSPWPGSRARSACRLVSSGAWSSRPPATSPGCPTMTCAGWARSSADGRSALLNQRRPTIRNLRPTMLSAQQHDPARQGGDTCAKELLDLGHEIRQPVELERAVDEAASELRVDDDDLARPVAVHFIHHASQRTVAEYQQ